MNKAIQISHLDPENLHFVGEGNRDPVRLRDGPLELVDLSLGPVGQDGVLDGLGHHRQVPDVRLLVVSCCTNIYLSSQSG